MLSEYHMNSFLLKGIGSLVEYTLALCEQQNEMHSEDDVHRLHTIVL